MKECCPTMYNDLSTELVQKRTSRFLTNDYNSTYGKQRGS